MTDQPDAPQCPHRHGPMLWVPPGPYRPEGKDGEWRCVRSRCTERATPATLQAAYERGRQDERQRAEPLALWLTDTAVEDMRNGRLPGVGGIALQPSEDHTLRAYLTLEHGTANTHVPQHAEAPARALRLLEHDLEQELEARDEAQDALLEASGAMGGPEWVSRTPEPDPPDSGDLHRDVPELARQIVAERDRLREALVRISFSSSIRQIYETANNALNAQPEARGEQEASHGRCGCGAPLEEYEDIALNRVPERIWRLRCSANEDHRPCPNCKQWVEWRESYGRYYHRGATGRYGDWSFCPGPSKEPA